MLDKIKKHLKEVIKIKTTPHSIAAGFAIGTFLAIFPTFYLALIPAIIITLIFKKISKIALFSAFAVWNPIVMASLYPSIYYVGNFVLRNISLENQIIEYFSNFVVGSTIFSISSAGICYLIIYNFAKSYQRRKSKQKKK